MLSVDDKDSKNNDKFVIVRKNLSRSLWYYVKQIKDTKLLQKISLVLKQLRETKGLTQEEIFNETNIHIGRIETAKVNVTISTLSTLCKFFDISLSEFIKRVEKL
ncbi:helix-turn-helix domain-containing protein [Asinibacterium sp. OR53]|uniref:helix-turn-helix domain-containing protein n=1 Tax=Asinibacterium sp. OR53 TaxID=925409 RepID=UPI000687A529|nr:helix-turn-helix transcriptional regulator [Asinibacterium sp. OR53]